MNSVPFPPLVAVTLPNLAPRMEAKLRSEIVSMSLVSGHEVNLIFEIPDGFLEIFHVFGGIFFTGSENVLDGVPELKRPLDMGEGIYDIDNFKTTLFVVVWVIDCVAGQFHGCLRGGFRPYGHEERFKGHLPGSSLRLVGVFRARVQSERLALEHGAKRALLATVSELAEVHV